MAESLDSHLLPGGFHHPEVFLWGNKTALVLGTAAAMAAAASIYAHWIAIVILAPAVLALSAVENESFLLFVIFLTPVSWVLSGDLPLHNVPDAFRILVAIGFFVGRMWRGQMDWNRLFRPAISRASLIFVFIIVIFTALGSVGLRDSAGALLEVVSFFGFFLLLLAWIDSSERFRKILEVLLWSTIVTAAFAIFQELTGSYTSVWLSMNPLEGGAPEWEGRATSFLNYPNSLAGYLNLTLPFALGCLALGQGTWKKLGGWTLGLGLVALACTQSLGGAAGFSAIFILALIFFVKDWKKRMLFLAGAFASAAALYTLRETINPTHVDALTGYDTMGRLLLWSVAWNFFTHSPIIGIGWGNFRWLYGSELKFSWITPDILDVHNIYLQLLAETGIVGFVSFFSILFLAFRNARRQLHSASSYLSRSLAFGVIGAIVGILVHGCVDFLFRVSPQFGTLFWVLLALLVAAASLEDQEFALNQS